jgi:long-chain acyl-CoA synthetase
MSDTSDLWPTAGRQVIRRERHFGDRVVKCFADRPSNAYAALVGAAARNPRGEAVVDGEVRMTYRALIESEFLVALYGTLRLGAIAVPVSIRESVDGLAFVLGDCGAVGLVHEADAALPEPAAVPTVAHRWAVGGEVARSKPFGALLAGGESVLPPLSRDEEATAVILYTSGTTGRPKGAMLRAAGCVVMMRRFDAADFLETAAREGITHTIMVPAMYNLCLLRARIEDYDLSAWRIGAYGGAPMPEATIAALSEKLPGLELANAYGSTETASPTTIMPVGRGRERADSVGAIMVCSDVLVVDDDGREVPHGEAGEIWIAGPNVVPGYWKRPEATAEHFAGPYWRSGDIGSIDEHGFLKVFDRKKDMINRAGFKIYSAEVENLLAYHPAVAEVAIVPRPDPVLGERVHCIIVSKPGAAADPDDIIAFCRSRLADYKVPETVALRDEPLPRNPNGKVLKRVLVDEDRAG